MKKHLIFGYCCWNPIELNLKTSAMRYFCKVVVLLLLAQNKLCIFGVYNFHCRKL